MLTEIACKNATCAVMTNTSVDTKIRLEAAKTLMPFCHAKAGEGVKVGKAAAAKKAASVRFGASPPPIWLVT
jgi:phage terminase small subunit